ncbi:RICIN domain-containing protein, partial [Kitasatospora paracochleata]
TQEVCTGAANQHWQIAPLPSGAYTITSTNSGLLLTTDFSDNNSLVSQDPNSGTPRQQWTIF